MRKFIVQAFDDFISGTSEAWYTPSTLNDQLGSADGMTIHAVPTDVSGTSPTVTCSVETSADGQHWLPQSATPVMNGLGLSDGVVREGNYSMITPFLHFVRVKVTLGGTSPACRLKLHIVGRAWGNGSATAPNPSGGRTARAPVTGNRRG